MTQTIETSPSGWIDFHGPDSVPVLAKGETYESVNENILGIPLKKGLSSRWLLGFTIAFGLLNLFVITSIYLVTTGIGIWGTTLPTMWAFPIINFVWWIGIGHAGTFISAFLLLLRQQWRTSINRFAEAMTLFAVACAGVFPLLHMGRPWLFYWLFPYPSSMTVWPQFRSPLVWDVFAVSTYGTVSLLFWYAGLVPDVAALRDRAKNRLVATIYGMMALGWRGSARHWQRHNAAYTLLAALSTPLVLSVHSIVGMDFAVAIVPGWHSTIFPPYFVAGAIFSGFAMVVTLAIPLRYYFHLENYLTIRHMSNAAKVMLLTGSIVGYGYFTEVFIAYYSGNTYERYVAINRCLGPYAWSYWAIVIINIFVPQIYWFPKIRSNMKILFVSSLVIQVGMWLERFMIIITSLHRDYLPSSWGMFYPTFWDITMLLGTIGLFFTLFFLFCRVLPVIAVAEMRELVHEQHAGH